MRTAGFSAPQVPKPRPTLQPRSSQKLQLKPLAASHPIVQAPHLCSAGPLRPRPGPQPWAQAAADKPA